MMRKVPKKHFIAGKEIPASLLRFSTEPGALTHAGDEVKRLISGLGGKTVREKLEHLGQKISRLPVKIMPREEISDTYGQRSAERILRNEVHKVVRVKSEPDIRGCVDYAIVATACLKALGFKSQFVRQADHSYALFLYRGQIYKFDPYVHSTDKGIPVVRKLTELPDSQQRLMRWAIHKGFVWTGRDTHDIGLDYKRAREILGRPTGS